MPLNILVVDGAPPDREASAGERATIDLIDGLRHLGHRVSLTALGLSGAGDERRVVALRERGIDLAPGWGGGLIHLKGLLDVDPWDVVMVHRPGPALLATAALQAHPDVATVYWGHDIHGWRLEAQAGLRGDVPAHCRRVTELSERRCWQFYDVSCYPTEREAEFVAASLTPGSDVNDATGKNPAGTCDNRVIAFPYYRLIAQDLESFSQLGASGLGRRQGCLFVGSASHAPNRDAVEWAATEILPLLQDAFPGMTLTVVGDWPDGLRASLARPGLRFLGRVTEEKLLTLHRRHVCLLAPLRFGAGSRRKLVAAMALGLPVVTTSEGLRGLLVRDAAPQDGVLVADDARATVAAVLELADRVDLWMKASARAHAAVIRVYGDSVYDLALKNLVAQLTTGQLKMVYSRLQ
jgi:glycosyltransferase involved in cell wall biosynthesis